MEHSSITNSAIFQLSHAESEKALQAAVEEARLEADEERAYQTALAASLGHSPSPSALVSSSSPSLMRPGLP
jgi:hypothetical protein